MAAYDVETREHPMAALGKATTASPDELSPCIKEVLSASGALDCVDKVLSDLESALFQVLRGESPTGMPDSIQQVAESPLHDALRTNRERIGLIENRIRYIKERLTI